eukprot:Rmarinus@m.11834
MPGMPGMPQTHAHGVPMGRPDGPLPGFQGGRGGFLPQPRPVHPHVPEPLQRGLLPSPSEAYNLPMNVRMALAVSGRGSHPDGMHHILRPPTPEKGYPGTRPDHTHLMLPYEIDLILRQHRLHMSNGAPAVEDFYFHAYNTKTGKPSESQLVLCSTPVVLECLTSQQVERSSSVASTRSLVDRNDRKALVSFVSPELNSVLGRYSPWSVNRPRPTLTIEANGDASVESEATAAPTDEAHVALPACLGVAIRALVESIYDLVLDLEDANRALQGRILCDVQALRATRRHLRESLASQLLKSTEGLTWSSNAAEGDILSQRTDGDKAALAQLFLHTKGLKAITRAFRVILSDCWAGEVYLVEPDRVLNAVVSIAIFEGLGAALSSGQAVDFKALEPLVALLSKSLELLDVNTVIRCSKAFTGGIEVGRGPALTVKDIPQLKEKRRLLIDKFRLVSRSRDLGGKADDELKPVWKESQTVLESLM